MGDVWLIIFLVAIPGGFVIWTTGKTRWLWLGCLFGMLAVLGGCEAYCKFVDVDHKTLSQRFYALPDVEAWLITIAMLIGWVALLLHLNWKRIKKLWEK
ncbi:MAG: hypothetical protein BWY42_01269 [Candidatus Omnitrophica bacterium ADurb.Bin277]|nr:MAG: hypothetical protein BWY42_01269 [Candidatus Omnitrophica bacterium ADurb.Bin277]